jgi:hypothetical protein
LGHYKERNIRKPSFYLLLKCTGNVATESINIIASEVLTPVSIKTRSSDFYCRPVQDENKLSLPPASTGFFFALLFCPENGGNMFLRDVMFSPNYKALQPRMQCSSNHN